MTPRQYAEYQRQAEVIDQHKKWLEEQKNKVQKEDCPTCYGEKTVVYSCCTGDVVDSDIPICPVCKEHLGEETCQTCDGVGEINA